MSDDIRIRPVEGTWVVRAGGAVLGESSNALELSAPGQPDRVYFPREDVAMAFLDRSDHVSHLPGVGKAVHFSIMAKSRTYLHAAWSYEAPEDGAEKIKDHIAFDVQDGVDVEEL